MMDERKGKITSQSRNILFFAGGLVSFFIVAVCLQWRLLPTGVPGQWEWPWRDLTHINRLHLMFIPALYLGLALFLYKMRQIPPRRFWIALFLLGCSLTIAVTMWALEANEASPPLHMAMTMASVPAMGYFCFATLFEDASSLLHSYRLEASLPGGFPGRVRTHPPGPALYCYLGLRFWEKMPFLRAIIEHWLWARYRLTPEKMWKAARWYTLPTVRPEHMPAALFLGWLLTLAGALLPIPAYFIGTGLDDKHLGLLNAFIAALLPSLVLFIPTIDAFAAVLALMPVALWIWALRRFSWKLFALSGLAMAAAVFWSVGLAAVSICMAALLFPVRHNKSLFRFYFTGGLIALGLFSAVYIILAVLGLYDLWENVRVIAEAQKFEMTLARRDYWTWLPWNVYDIWLFGGPVFWAWTLGGIFLWKEALGAFRAYIMGAFVMLGFLWISGATLGEVGRIWLFALAVLAPSAAWALKNTPPQTAGLFVTLTALAQSSLVLLLHARLALVQL